jgi:hypothetical protein
MRLTLLVLGGLVAAAPSAIGAAPLTNPLTADQVTCDELQLERLALRAAVAEPSPFDFAHPSLFLWYSQGGGAYSALAVSDGISGGESAALPLFRSETQLAIDISLHSTADFLNPARLSLPQATAVRREVDSNLIAPGVAKPNLVVLFALEPKATNPFAPSIPLEVNNLTVASGSNQPMAYASGSGRGIGSDDLTSSCENLLTPFDQRVFTILSRTVRMAQCALLRGFRPSCNPDGSAYNVTLFRATDPQTYRANVYSYVAGCTDAGVCSYSVSKVAYQFTLNWDSNGNLTTGQVTVLPPCPSALLAPGCSNPGGNQTPMFILPPLWPGNGHQGPEIFALGAVVWDDGPGSSNNVLSASINWQLLLAGSAWQ